MRCSEVCFWDLVVSPVLQFISQQILAQLVYLEFRNSSRNVIMTIRSSFCLGPWGLGLVTLNLEGLRALPRLVPPLWKATQNPLCHNLDVTTHTVWPSGPGSGRDWASDESLMIEVQRQGQRAIALLISHRWLVSKPQIFCLHMPVRFLGPESHVGPSHQVLNLHFRYFPEQAFQTSCEHNNSHNVRNSE